MPKTTLEFEGFEEVIARLSKLEGNVKATTKKALEETHKIVTSEAKSAINRHYLTGQTEHSLKEQANIEWSGSMASVEVGFNIRQGGLPSIFLMYGTPRMRKDQNLYDAFWGTKTLNTIHETQANIFFDAIRKLGG